MVTPFVGAQKYLVLASEDVWGRNPDVSSGTGSGTQAYVHVPVLDYNVKLAMERRQANPFLGILQRKHSTPIRGMPTGTLTCALHGYHPGSINVSLAQYLCDWAFSNPESTEPPSKTAQWYEATLADKEHVGLRVNQATLSGDSASGVIQIQLDLMGKDENGNGTFTAESLPNDRDKIVDFEFADATFQLAGATVQLDSFSLTLQRNLQSQYLNNRRPAWLLATGYTWTFQANLLKLNDTYDGYRRQNTAAEFTGQLVLKGLHNGTGASGTYSQVQFDFDRLSFQESDDQGGHDDIILQQINTVGLKPDTANNGLRTTWSLS